MLALFTGLVGAFIGWLLKTASDLRAERRANERADTTWRRERYVDGVADLLSAARELMAAASRISRAVFSLSNAESAGNPGILASCQAQHRDAVEAQAPWTTATIAALESVRLYGPDSVVTDADAVWTALHNNGQFPEVLAIGEFEQAVTDALSDLRATTRKAAVLEQ